jgi:hypothetical protein
MLDLPVLNRKGSDRQGVINRLIRATGGPRPRDQDFGYWDLRWAPSMAVLPSRTSAVDLIGRHGDSCCQGRQPSGFMQVGADPCSGSGPSRGSCCQLLVIVNCSAPLATARRSAVALARVSWGLRSAGPGRSRGRSSRLERIAIGGVRDVVAYTSYVTNLMR